MNLSVMSIEEQATDGVSGDFTVVLWDNEADEHYCVHCTYLLKDDSVIPQNVGLPWQVVSHVSSSLYIRSELREAVRAERDGLEEDARQKAAAAKQAAKAAPPKYNVN